MIRAYYNDHDKKVCAWLEQLIKNGDITKGDVDDRSITEITADDIAGYDRVHLFAGIGTWDYALNQAGWGDRPVLTASLPCQPFSAAGKGLGKQDERHLLPQAVDLIIKSGIDTIFGEQVERAITHGWLDDLQAVMEAENYAVGHVVLGAHSVNSAHIRQRLYWVANSINNNGQRKIRSSDGKTENTEAGVRKNINESRQSCGASDDVLRLADTNNTRPQGRTRAECSHKQPTWKGCMAGWLADCNGTGSLKGREATEGTRYRYPVESNGDIDWIYCKDGKHRPIKPGIFPLADGSTRTMVYRSHTIPSLTELVENFEDVTDGNNTQEARAMRLKGYGNAIQAQTAEAFIRAFMSI